MKNIYFIGIGGIGMSGLANILLLKGNKITGSDTVNSEIIEDLKAKGVTVFSEHKNQNITKEIDFIIYSQAITENNPEIIEAKKLNLKIYSYPEYLGEFSKDYFLIAIAGTHGKSTTTAITALVLEDLDPTVIVGTKIREFKGKNYRLGKSKYLILEACEYKEAFLNLKPDILVITNIEPEHLDYFKNEENYHKAFEKIKKNLRKNGKIIDETSISNKKIEHISIKPNVPGKHNVYNASLAAIVGTELGVPNKIIEQKISKFSGTWRRMEIINNNWHGKKIYDDYAHHPTEIRVTLEALKEKYPQENICCVFQPHQYSRTASMLQEFANSLQLADQVIIPNIYRVRDTDEDVSKINTDTLVDAINQHNKIAINGNGLEETYKYLEKSQKETDIIILMGAGDIAKMRKMFSQ